MYDVVVVGAGPAGLICAQGLSGEVLVVEEDPKIGEPVNCAGLFSISGLEKLGIKASKDFVLNTVKGARIVSPGGKVAQIGVKEPKAYVVDRGAFDRYLAKGFEGELKLKSRCKAVKKSKNFELAIGGEKTEAKNVVLATGVNYNLAGDMGFPKPKRFINSIQYEMKGVNAEPDFVELYMGSVAPGFFAWVIPIDDSHARVGLGVLDAPEQPVFYMKRFLERLKKDGRFKEGNKVVHKGGGLIPVYEENLAVKQDGAYLLGDAATQVKATTGGGVIMGGLAAKTLANCINNGGNYELRLEDMNKELKQHLFIRNMLNRFGDEQYENMVEFLNRPDVKGMIEDKGDMDFVTPIIKSLMANPIMMVKAMGLFGKGLLF